MKTIKIYKVHMIKRWQIKRSRSQYIGRCLITVYNSSLDFPFLTQLLLDK